MLFLMKGKEFPLDELLGRVEEGSTTMKWPAPLHQRLNELVDLAVAAGEKTSRSELTAALVLNAVEDGQELGRLIHNLRLARVRDVLVNRAAIGKDAKVITLVGRSPGPRSR